MKHTSTLFALLAIGSLALDAHATSLVSGFVTSPADALGMVSSELRDTSLVGPAVRATRVLYGRVEGPTGALPGAVVRLTGSKQTTVTNAAGEFSLTVPVNSEPLAATVSYAGYADVPVVLSATEQNAAVRLTSPRIIKVSRKQQAKHYLKTAHRQIRRTMRRL
jgi:hypothetical protein